MEREYTNNQFHASVVRQFSLLRAHRYSGRRESTRRSINIHQNFKQRLHRTISPHFTAYFDIHVALCTDTRTSEDGDRYIIKRKRREKIISEQFQSEHTLQGRSQCFTRYRVLKVGSSECVTIMNQTSTSRDQSVTLSEDNRINISRAWLLPGLLTAQRPCSCKQPACPTVGGGSEVTFKQLVPWLCVTGYRAS
ncbi:hypothetical protein J6590_072555 [Homalodisca vitripennis]|nr:hypothetical protein J6590_072555 [Homalodisca vitripennis]